MPEKTIIDGHSFAPQLRGEKGQPRDWAFNQLAKLWYVREAGWKLNQAGELFDMSDAPFAEKLVAADTKDPAAIAARKRLQPVLDKLNPAGGILDQGDGTGRHANKVKKKKNERVMKAFQTWLSKSRPSWRWLWPSSSGLALRQCLWPKPFRIHIGR